MKKILLLSLLSLGSLSYSSPNCLGYPNNQHFRKIPLQRIECNCPCTYRADHVDKYECVECKHRLLPKSLEVIIIAPQILKNTQDTQVDAQADIIDTVSDIIDENLDIL